MTREEFWANVAVGGPEDCWPFLRCRVGLGYGSLRFEGRTWLAHRVAYLLTYGNVPPALRHTCDNYPCCNPNHLLPGDQKANMADCRLRGRSGGQSPGELHTEAKLTAREARSIRERYAAGDHRIGQMVREFHISRAQVRRIGVGQAWKVLDTVAVPNV